MIKASYTWILIIIKHIKRNRIRSAWLNELAGERVFGALTKQTLTLPLGVFIPQDNVTQRGGKIRVGEKWASSLTVGDRRLLKGEVTKEQPHVYRVHLSQINSKIEDMCKSRVSHGLGSLHIYTQCPGIPGWRSSLGSPIWSGSFGLHNLLLTHLAPAFPFSHPGSSQSFSASGPLHCSLCLRRSSPSSPSYLLLILLYQP